MQKTFTTMEIAEIIPHRSPFLLVDKIIDVSDDCKQITGVKSVTYNEDFFRGHFPGKPVMPGVLQVEAVAQAAAFLILKFDESAKDYQGLAFTGIKNVKFRKPVTPGDQLLLKATLLKKKGPYYSFEGHAEVDGDIAFEGAFQAIFLDKRG